MPDRLDRLKEINARARAVGGASARVQAARAESPSGGDAPTSAELWLYGVVGGWWFGFDSETVADALRGLDVDQLTVRLHSPGGSQIEGIAIGNLLRNHKATVTMVVDGLAASAASVIALAGDEIVMSPGSQAMIHDVSLLTFGNAADLRSDADWLDGQSANYASIYADQAGGTPESWREAMLADGGGGTWYTAQEAVDAGLAHRVGTIQSTTPPPAVPEPDLGDEEEMSARAAWDLEVLVHPAARAVWRESGYYKLPTASAGGSTPPEGAAVVDLNDEQIASLREQVGFAENADADTIVSAVTEALAERASDDTPPAPQVPEGMVLVEQDVWESTRTQASQGAAARQQQLDDHRDRTIDAAVADGRVTPARREHWATAWNADPTGTEELIGGLPKGLVPVAEFGHSGEPETTAEDELYTQLFGAEKAGV